MKFLGTMALFATGATFAIGCNGSGSSPDANDLDVVITDVRDADVVDSGGGGGLDVVRIDAGDADVADDAGDATDASTDASSDAQPEDVIENDSMVQHCHGTLRGAATVDIPICAPQITMVGNMWIWGMGGPAAINGIQFAGCNIIIPGIVTAGTYTNMASSVIGSSCTAQRPQVTTWSAGSDNTTNVVGSITLTVTSFDVLSAGVPPTYTPHGTLTGSMIDGANGPTLDMSFVF